MGFFETGLPERPSARRTQRPRPVAWYNRATGQAEWRQSEGYYWEEIGLRTDVSEPQGLLPSGNNLYAILQRDILTPGVTLQMYGWLGEELPYFPRVSPALRGYLNADPRVDAPIWFNRSIPRGAALDALQAYARGGDQEQFLRDLSTLTGYNIREVDTIRVMPSAYGREGYFG